MGGGSTTVIEPSIPKEAKPYWDQFANMVKNRTGELGGVRYPTESFGRYTGLNSRPYAGIGTQKYSGPFAGTYTGKFTAGMTEDEQNALKGLRGWAMAASPLETAGQDLLMQTLGGKFLDPASNPYVKQMTAGMSDDMSKAIAAASQGLGDVFSRAGVTYRGPAEQNMRQGALKDFGNSLTNLYGGLYSNERGNMMNALNQAQSWAGMPANRFSTLMQAGAIPRSIEQSDLASRYSDWARAGQQDYGEATRLGNLDYADWSRLAGQDYNDWQRSLAEQKSAYMLPMEMQANLFNSMPLAYPQYYNQPGFFDQMGQGLGQALPWALMAML